jgi:membrane protease YdiL (CAAX protease family)
VVVPGGPSVFDRSRWIGAFQAIAAARRYRIVRRCEQCGAASPVSATWCTQCCASFAPAAPAAYAAATIAPLDAVGVAAATPPVAFSAVVPAAPPPFVPAPPPAVGYVAPYPTLDDGRILDRRALRLVVVSIGLGVVMQIVALALAHVKSLEPETLIRYDIVLTLGLYAAVTVLIVRQITPSVRLRWGEGPLFMRIAVGAVVGVVISLALLGLVSAASGHLQSDPRIMLLMSEGDPTHILVAVFLTCLAAPLVEETLFRGLLLESLLPRGRRLALFTSAAAFAVWHLNVASLVYYFALGAALGSLYLRRGMAGSMAAHAGFNGVLTIAAIFAVLTPSHVITVGALSLDTPRGWSQHAITAEPLHDAEAFLVGPSDAELAVVPGPEVGALDPQQIANRMRNDALPSTPETFVDHTSVREIAVPAGVVVEEDVTVSGRAGIIAVVDVGGQLDELVFFGAGSAKATADFTNILESLRPA